MHYRMNTITIIFSILIFYQHMIIGAKLSQHFFFYIDLTKKIIYFFNFFVASPGKESEL